MLSKYPYGVEVLALTPLTPSPNYAPVPAPPKLMELLHPLPRLPLTVAHAVPQELHALSLNANANAHPFRHIPIHGAFNLI